MTPAHRSLCPACHHRGVPRRIDHPAGVVLRCPRCGGVRALHRARRLSAV